MGAAEGSDVVATAGGELPLVAGGRVGLGAVVGTVTAAVVGTGTGCCVRAYGPQAAADRTSASASSLRSTGSIVRTDRPNLDPWPRSLRRRTRGDPCEGGRASRYTRANWRVTMPAATSGVPANVPTTR